MAVRILKDGTIEADTAKELVDYQAMVQAGFNGVATPPAKEPKHGWATLVGNLEGPDPKKGTQRKLLSLVKSAKTIDIVNLSKLLGANAQTVGGHVSGLRKRALTAGLSADDLIVKVGTTITAGPALLANDLPASWR